jgi:hypothetical protein
MKENPFPGMNPWLESHWGDVHTSLTTYARDQRQPQLPTGLRARVEEYVAVEADDESDATRDRFAPDVRIVERPGAATLTSAAVAEVSQSVMVPRRLEPETLHRIEIVDAAVGHRTVTTIEFLNLANKVGDDGRRQYRAKQHKMLAGYVNLVEIDLLRDGSWVLAVPEALVPARCREPYRICVVRGDRQSVAEMYPVPLSQPLPTIRIPLRTGDNDVVLKLQPLLNTSYVNGRYDEDLDYRKNPDPPLADTDAQWADRLLREKGLR